MSGGVIWGATTLAVGCKWSGGVSQMGIGVTAYGSGALFHSS